LSLVAEFHPLCQQASDGLIIAFEFGRFHGQVYMHATLSVSYVS
jgi:hypothetical protein